jgi:hypothetical protein
MVNLIVLQMKPAYKDEVLFAITLEDLQIESKNRIGRYLSEHEVGIAKKGLEFGLLTGIDIVFETIFHEMLEI